MFVEFDHNPLFTAGHYGTQAKLRVLDLRILVERHKIMRLQSKYNKERCATVLAAHFWMKKLPTNMASIPDE